jgi:hypothetical protein
LQSKFDAQFRAYRPGLARQDQTVPEIVGLEDLARGHLNVTLDDGRHTRPAAAFPARVGHVNPRIEQHVDEAPVLWPRQPVPQTVQLDLNVCNFRHAAILCRRNAGEGVGARWLGILDRSVR